MMVMQRIQRASSRLLACPVGRKRLSAERKGKSCSFGDLLSREPASRNWQPTALQRQLF